MPSLENDFCFCVFIVYVHMTIVYVRLCREFLLLTQWSLFHQSRVWIV